MRIRRLRRRKRTGKRRNEQEGHNHSARLRQHLAMCVPPRRNDFRNVFKGTQSPGMCSQRRNFQL